MTDIHAAVWDWLLTCPAVNDLFFSFGRTENGDTVLVPVSDDPMKTFTNGSSERRAVFALTRVDAISDAPNSGENIEVLQRFDALAEWIEAQNKAHIYPGFPKGIVIDEITVLSSASFAAQDEGQAKLMFQFSMNYLKEV